MNNGRKTLIEDAGVNLIPCYGTMGRTNNVYLELNMVYLRQIGHLYALLLDKRTNNQDNPNSYTQQYLKR